LSGKGGSLDQDPLEGSPPNPHVGFYRWLAFDPRMFIPPWYQQPIVQFVLEPTIKLSYKKLQYPTYVKNTNLNAHIKVFKKAIKANGETMEVDLINLVGFTLQNNILEWGENFVQDHSNCTFEKLEQTFYKHFQIVKNDEEVYMQLRNLQQ
jgi:hypothetical protein